MPRARRPQERYRWNAQAARYVDQRTGRFVPNATVRRALDRALDTTQKRMTTATNKLRAGRLSLGDWQDTMRENIRDIHLYSAATAKGGWGQLSRGDRVRIGKRLQGEYRYLDKWARGMEDGSIPMDGRLLQRTGLYAQAGRGTFHVVERDDKSKAGYTEERNELGPADHCSSCMSESGRGWVRIGSLIPIGRRTCGGNCRCSTAYR